MSEQKRQRLSASLEDYIEAIHHVQTRKKVARVKDLTKALGVNASSVTGALQALAKRELVNYAPYDVITLTPQGEKQALDVMHRHEALHDFFVKVLGLAPDLAESAACNMEHAVSPAIRERLVEYLEYVEATPSAAPVWVEGKGFRAPDTTSGDGPLRSPENS